MRFIANGSQVLMTLCKAEGAWGLLLSTCSATPDDVKAAAPYLSDEQAGQLWHEGTAFLLFDTEAEMEAAYWQTVGDDGPTKTNPYDGPGRVYALTCRPDGQLVNENT